MFNYRILDFEAVNRILKGCLAQGGGGYLEAMSDVKFSKASSSVFYSVIWQFMQIDH